MPKVFLDKIVTSAHFPPAEGSRKYTSTITFPDLSHTMISTKFCPILPSAMTPNGEMTRTYKRHAFRQYQTCERPSAEIKMKKRFFLRASHVFNNKVLLDLEQMKLTRNERRQRIWTKGKKDHGFEGLEESFIGIESGMDTFPGASMSRGDSQRAMTASNPTSNQQPQSHFFLKEGDGRLGADAGAYSDDYFEVADDFNASWVDSKVPAGLEEDYGTEQFELSTPVLSATIPTKIPDRPTTSAAQATRLNSTYPPPATSYGGRSNSPVVEDDLRVGMQRRLQAENNYLIAEEEANFVPVSTSLSDIAYRAVGRVPAAETTSSRPTSAESKAETVIADVKVEETQASSAMKNLFFTQGSSSKANEEVKDDAVEYKAVGVKFGCADNAMAVQSKALTATASTTLSKISKFSVSKKQSTGIAPARVRGAFSRETYFECLFDTIDIPEPHAARFGMMQSPKCKSSEERKAQRRAQTADFVPPRRFKVDSPVNVPEDFSKSLISPIKNGKAKRADLDAEFGEKVLQDHNGTEPLELEDGEGEGVEEGEGEGGGEAEKDEVIPPPLLRKLSKGSMKNVLIRLATAGDAGGRNRKAAPQSVSPIAKAGLIPTDKWRVEAMERAVTGDVYGVYKARQYR